MSNNLSQASVLKTYRSVIEDTIASSREAFLDEGIDEQVLQELKQLWESKITNSKAVQIDLPVENLEVASSTSNARKAQPLKRKENEPQSMLPAVSSTNVSNGKPNVVQTVTSLPQQVQPMMPPAAAAPPPQQPQQLFSNMLDANKIVPIQITLPPQPGQQARVLTIQVPAMALVGNQLQQVLTGPVISATMGLPQPQASNLLQQHVNAALQGQKSPLLAIKTIPQTDGALPYSDDDDITLPIQIKKVDHKRRKRRLKGDAIPQVDGALDDSSNPEDDISEDSSEDEDIDDDDKDEEDPDMDDGGVDQEPLNSEDDVSEEDPSDLFDTDNVVVCQYDKINRIRNKWKFCLKDGIMNLNGKDFIFQKITGDAEW